jgi:hypothetical protein
MTRYMNKSNGKFLAAILAIALGACAVAAKDAEPPVASMKIAKAVGKTGAPVEVRYEPTGSTLRGQPTTLKLAFVPQIAASNLEVEFPASDAVSIDWVLSRLSVSNPERDGVYRRALIVTPRLADSGEVRVMVWVDAEGGRYFSIFTVPVGK